MKRLPFIRMLFLSYIFASMALQFNCVAPALKKAFTFSDIRKTSALNWEIEPGKIFRIFIELSVQSIHLSLINEEEEQSSSELPEFQNVQFVEYHRHGTFSYQYGDGPGDSLTCVWYPTEQ